MGFIMKGQASRVDKGNKRVKHLLFRVWGSGFRDPGFGVCDLYGAYAQKLRIRVWNLGIGM